MPRIGLLRVLFLGLALLPTVARGQERPGLPRRPVRPAADFHAHGVGVGVQRPGRGVRGPGTARPERQPAAAVEG